MHLLPTRRRRYREEEAGEKNFCFHRFAHFCRFVPRPRHLQGSDGSPEDPGLSSALAADPAGARAGTALLWPGSHVPTIPEATCGP